MFIGNVVTSKYNKIDKHDCKNMWEECMKIEGIKFKVKLDTGADVNIMPYEKFQRLECSYRVRKTDYILKAFEGAVAKPIGIVNLSVRYKDKCNFEDFVIVKGANQRLLGERTCVHLGLIKRINKVNVCIDERKEMFVNENIDIFKGSGRLPRKCEIVTTREFEPICHPPSKIPFAIRQPLRDELNRLVKRKAIEKVDIIDSRASINRIVIVEKSNGKIRLCLDPSDLNKYTVRKPRVSETIEEICAKFLNKKIFSVFDLSEGYHQIEIDEGSSWKCCFATPFGMYRFKVLTYGLSNSQDIFQDEIEKYFADIENVVICHDDMIIAAKDDEEHKVVIKQIVERARQVGARFNQNKLQFYQERVKFMGQVFSKNGMQVDPDRIEALDKLGASKSKVELQRILGSFNYTGCN